MGVYQGNRRTKQSWAARRLEEAMGGFDSGEWQSSKSKQIHCEVDVVVCSIGMPLSPAA